ncbi:MAG TPA: ornithine cyclodeaminase family protein, partial [Pyrinomonadaceae bacterium]|nr:ornithine cyclodeaminase family protein [Pyrinomonadaceae bacterium]
TLGRGQAHQPLRTIFKPAEVKGVLAMMPAFRAGESPLFGLKAICVFPGNAATGLDAHQGGVMLFDGTAGVPIALVNASAITAIRTAAVSGLATSLLARRDAAELAIIGAGVQARTHLSAMACVRPIKRARIASGRFENAQKFAKEMLPQFPFPVEPVETAEAAVRGADLIVTATTAREPVVRRDWISPGVHINAIGTFSPGAREIDTATMAAATLFCDARESVLNEAGDYLLAAKEGAIGPDHIRAELGEVLIKAHPGRTSRDEITIFKSLGIAIEDLAAADHVYRKAEKETAGTWVEF